MAHTVFVDGSTVTANRIVAAWLNDADTVTYVRFGDGTSYTGNLTVPGTTSLTGALTYGGVTLSNSVTGTGSMMLAASPTTTGTLTAAAINASGDFNRTQSVDSVILVDCNNTANTSGASSRVRSIVGGSSASDPVFQWVVTGITSWYAGIDNSVSDQFVIASDTIGGASDWLKITTAGAVTIPGTLGVGDITTNGNNKGLYFNGTRNGILGSNAADTVSIAAANANVAVFGAASTSLTGTLGVTGLVTGDAGFAQIKNTGLMANGAQYTIGPAYATGMFVIREFQVSGDMAIYLFSTDASTPVRLVDGSSNWSAAPSGASFNVWMNGANLVIQNTAGGNRAFKYSLLYAG